MALFNPILGQLSGKVGGNVFGHNKAGQNLRQYVVPTNPSTLFQQVYRGIFAQIAALWANSLSAANRAGWQDYAANTPTYNRLGNQIFLDGLNWFIAYNVNKFAAVGSYRFTPPTAYGLAQLTPPAVTVTVAAGTASVVFEESDPWSNNDDGILVCSQGISVGPAVNFFAKQYRPASFILGDSVTPPTSPAAIASLPFAVAAGQNSFWRFRALNGEGQISQVVKVKATLA